MSSLKREVWGREFDLGVRFEDLDNEGVSDAQWDAYGHIIAAWSAVDDALSRVKEYCIEQNPDKLCDDTFGSVFRCVIPKDLFIPKTAGRRTVALMCNYRFDPEHGLAIVFEDEMLAGIGPQDIVL